MRVVLVQLCIAALVFPGSLAWVPSVAHKRFSLSLLAKARGSSTSKSGGATRVASGGFGAKAPPKAESKGVGTGMKALQAQYKTFCSLKEGGAKLFDVFVRGDLSPGKKSGEFTVIGFSLKRC
jgi:hypothetical protein